MLQTASISIISLRGCSFLVSGGVGYGGEFYFAVLCLEGRIKTEAEVFSFIATERFWVWALWVLMVAGGIWHLTGLFGTLMAWFSGPMVIGLGILAWWFSAKAGAGRAFHVWALGVVICTWYIEYLGVSTGLIFGEYRYGEVLWPAPLGTPVAIGFAWLGMIVSARAIIASVPRRVSLPLVVVGTALLMTVFDVVMEPAAIALGYWTWGGASAVPPLQNYVAWFSIGALLTLAGELSGVFREQPRRIGVHLWVAQMVYFLLVLAR